MHGVFSYLFRRCRIEKTWGTTCGKADHLWQPYLVRGGPSMAEKFAVDGPGGPLTAGDQLRRDRPPNNLYIHPMKLKYGLDDLL